MACEGSPEGKLLIKLKILATNNKGENKFKEKYKEAKANLITVKCIATRLQAETALVRLVQALGG